jgi:hypothetical protein
MITILTALALQATLPAKEDCFAVDGRATCVVVPSSHSNSPWPGHAPVWEFLVAHPRK